MNRSLFLLFTLASVCLVAFTAHAQTCDMLPVLTPHAVDPSLQGTDHSPPSLRFTGTPAVRGVLTTGSSCLSEPSSACESITLIDLQLSATDDMTPPDKIGYRLSLESGTLPPNLVLPPDAVEGVVKGRLTIVWVNPRREPIGYFTLRVVAVDAAGNESAPETTLVRDLDFGCEAVAPPRAGPAALALLFAAWRRLRRRR